MHSIQTGSTSRVRARSTMVLVVLTALCACAGNAEKFGTQNPSGNGDTTIGYSEAGSTSGWLDSGPPSPGMQQDSQVGVIDTGPAETGTLPDSQSIWNDVGPASICGDGTCDPAVNETCGTCPQDCGQCVVHVAGNGQPCNAACAQSGMNPITSGNFTLLGNPFYYCATNVQNEGWRPGFNLVWGPTFPRNGTACVTAWGNTTQHSTDYLCACAADGGQWMHAQTIGVGCNVVCANSGKVALSPGVFQVNGQPFFYCAANVQNEGWRPGFNLVWGPTFPTDGTACVLSWDSSALFEAAYLCLCTNP
jgi:hypothetical protein